MELLANVIFSWACSPVVDRQKVSALKLCYLTARSVMFGERFLVHYNTVSLGRGERVCCFHFKTRLE